MTMVRNQCIMGLLNAEKNNLNTSIVTIIAIIINLIKVDQ